MKKVIIELMEDEYGGLVQFLKQREQEIRDDQEDLGLLLPLLDAFNSRVIWTKIVNQDGKPG